MNYWQLRLKQSGIKLNIKLCKICHGIYIAVSVLNITMLYTTSINLVMTFLVKKADLDFPFRHLKNDQLQYRL